MRLIVADAYGTGVVSDSEHGEMRLDPGTWTEIDVRATIRTGDGESVTLCYRDDGRQVEIGPNATYDIEYSNPDVVDHRLGSAPAAEIIAACDGPGTDEERIYQALAQVHGNAAAIEQVDEIIREHRGMTLVELLEDELSGEELARALAYLH
jgi:hypothetical protein